MLLDVDSWVGVGARCSCLGLLGVIDVFAVVAWAFGFVVFGGCWMRCLAVSRSDCIRWCCVCWRGHGGLRGGRKSSWSVMVGCVVAAVVELLQV